MVFRLEQRTFVAMIFQVERRNVAGSYKCWQKALDGNSCCVPLFVCDIRLGPCFLEKRLMAAAFLSLKWISFQSFKVIRICAPRNGELWVSEIFSLNIGLRAFYCNIWLVVSDFWGLIGLILDCCVF